MLVPVDQQKESAMHRRLLHVLSICVIATWCATAVAQRPIEVFDRDPEGTGGGPTLEAVVPAGAYLISAHEGIGRMTVPFMVEFNADGCASSSSPVSVLGRAGEKTESLAIGVWSQPEPKQTRATVLYFTYNYRNALIKVTRGTLVLNYLPPQETNGFGTLTLEHFMPYQILNPLRPNTTEVPLLGVDVLPMEFARVIPSR
jgi:hypothetical protein